MISVVLSMFLALPTIACEQVFWGTVEYIDENDQGQQVEKVELFQVKEWSAQSQFKRLLIEKADLKQHVGSLQLSTPSMAISQSLGLKEWSRNSDYYEVTGLDMRLLESQREVTIGYGQCLLTIPIKMRH